jgi:hypothetical protein
MAYTPFDPTKPDATAQTLTQMGTSERNNFLAIRDAVIMGGGFYGWNMAASGGTAAEPALLTYSSGTERVKAALTWSSGNVTVAVYSYSSNSGGAYDTIGTKTITYDGSNNVTAATWS